MRGGCPVSRKCLGKNHFVTEYGDLGAAIAKMWGGKQQVVTHKGGNSQPPTQCLLAEDLKQSPAAATFCPKCGFQVSCSAQGFQVIGHLLQAQPWTPSPPTTLTLTAPPTCLPGWQNGQPCHLLASPEHQIGDTGDLWGHQAKPGKFSNNSKLWTHLRDSSKKGRKTQVRDWKRNGNHRSTRLSEESHLISPIPTSKFQTNSERCYTHLAMSLVKGNFPSFKVEINKKKRDSFLFCQVGPYTENADSLAMSRNTRSHSASCLGASSRMASDVQGGSWLCQPIPEDKAAMA